MTLAALARAHGIETRYRAMDGRTVAAADDAVVAVLQALGVPIRRPDDAARLLRAHRAEQQKHPLPRVLVAWDGKLALPAGWKPTLTDEDGRELRMGPGRRLPPGYLELEAQKGGTMAHALVISAPRRAFAHRQRPQLGFFAPVYALRSARNFGIGDFTDLAGLLAWARENGAGFVGTLPLLAQHLDDPFDPSPYSPASRLFWNELLVDLERAPEMLSEPRVRALLDSADVQKELRRLRSASHVQYRRVVALKERALALLAAAFFRGHDPSRMRAYEDWRRTQLDLDDYAEFRAGDDHRAADVHRYAQLLCHEQLAAVTRDAQAGLYLDLPLGAHRDSYDLWRHRDDFALDATIGAPPDAFFTEGQSWGFPPPHPERMRASRYRYLRASIAHSMQFASLLRVDHVMGLHRLLWIPAGGEPKDGLYVRYPHDELYAVLSVESHRAKCEVAGEDLGLVPDEVRAAMRAHGLLRLYVLPWELGASGQRRPNPIPKGSIACLGTHDMLPFASQWGDARLAERAQRQLRCEHAAPDEFLAHALRFVCGSGARYALVSVEDLWLETEPQNVPGTVDDANWSRKCAHELARFAPSAPVRTALRRHSGVRKPAAAPLRSRAQPRARARR